MQIKARILKILKNKFDTYIGDSNDNKNQDIVIAYWKSEFGAPENTKVE